MASITAESGLASPTTSSINAHETNIRTITIPEPDGHILTETVHETSTFEIASGLIPTTVTSVLGGSTKTKASGNFTQVIPLVQQSHTFSLVSPSASRTGSHNTSAVTDVSSAGLSIEAQVGIGAGVGSVGALLLILLVISCCARRGRRFEHDVASCDLQAALGEKNMSELSLSKSELS